MHTQAPDRHARTSEEGNASLRERLEEREPNPLDPPYQDPDDPDLVPEEDDDFAPPGEEDEYATPAVDPHEEPLVTP